MTVKQLRAKLSELGLPPEGKKIALVERLQEHAAQLSRVTLEAGQRAPDFSQISNDYSFKQLGDFAGRKLLLWFYPGGPQRAGFGIHHKVRFI